MCFSSLPVAESANDVMISQRERRRRRQQGSSESSKVSGKVSKLKDSYLNNQETGHTVCGNSQLCCCTDVYGNKRYEAFLSLVTDFLSQQQ